MIGMYIQNKPEMEGKGQEGRGGKERKWGNVNYTHSNHESLGSESWKRKNEVNEKKMKENVRKERKVVSN